MTDEEAEKLLRIAVKRERVVYGMTGDEAVKILENLLDMPALTVPELIALNIAINALERPAQSRWAKPEDQLPESFETILMATYYQGLRAYHIGFYDGNGDWTVRPDLRANSMTMLISPPDYWCYINEPEVSE